MDVPQTTLLLRRVARRLRIAAFGLSAWQSFLALGGVFLVALLVTRLTGLAPHWNEELVLAALPVAALLLAGFLHRRWTLSDAARQVDQHAGAKDLFLTVSLLNDAPGEFKPLVVRDAEERAPRIKPAAVVPFDFGRPLLTTLTAVVLLLAMVGWLPTFDLFGQVAAAKEAAREKEQLAKSRKSVKERLEALKKDTKEEGEHSEDVENALKELKSSLNTMKPKLQKDNQKQLASQQKTMGQLWQKISAEKLKEMSKDAQVAQQFGGADTDKLKKWAEELKEGSTESLQKELSELMKDVEELKKTTDPAQKEKLAQKLKKRLEDLSDFATDKAQSPQLQAALEKALQQLDLSKRKELSEDATEAAKEAMELSKAELKQMGLSKKDMKAVEEALKVLQMARKLNDKEQLDGEACKNCQSMEDYEKLYAQLMAERGGEMEAEGEGEGEGEGGDGKGKGNGKGLGGEGIGEGGAAPEDDSVQTAFKDEQSRSPVTAGKVIMTLKSKGVGEKGEASKEYREAVRKVKQGVQSAIEADQIPPGYHDGIKSYFDSIEKDAK